MTDLDYGNNHTLPMLSFLSVLLSLASYPDSYSIYYANTYAYVSQAYSSRNRCFP